MCLKQYTWSWAWVETLRFSFWVGWQEWIYKINLWLHEQLEPVIFSLSIPTGKYYSNSCDSNNQHLLSGRPGGICVNPSCINPRLYWLLWFFFVVAHGKVNLSWSNVTHSHLSRPSVQEHMVTHCVSYVMDYLLMDFSFLQNRVCCCTKSPVCFPVAWTPDVTTEKLY